MSIDKLLYDHIFDNLYDNLYKKEINNGLSDYEATKIALHIVKNLFEAERDKIKQNFQLMTKDNILLLIAKIKKIKRFKRLSNKLENTSI